MNTLVLLVAVCVVAALGLAEARGLTNSALEQLFHRRRQTKETEHHQRRETETGGHDFRRHSETSQLLRRPTDKRRQAQCQGNPSVAVMECLHPLESMEHPTTGIALDELDTPEALDIMCQAMDTATECVTEVHHSCGQEDLLSRTVLETMEGVTGFLCQPKSRQLIVEEADCWENSEVEAEIEQCPVKNDPGPGGDYCGAMEGMISCVKNAVASHCSSRAANFVGRLFYLAINPVASNLLDCDLQMRVARSVMSLLPMTKRK